MSLFEGFDRMRLVKVGPSLRERLEWKIAGWHHRTVVARLTHLRRQLERDMAPQPWTALEAPAVLLLSEACDALALAEEERAGVLGPEGVRALADVLETRVYPRDAASLVNERQAQALRCVRERGRIDLGTYRALCPLWSDETLRLDLADLVARGLLTKNGTYYTMNDEPMNDSEG
ncbi:MAG: hypothetical protein ISS49_00490 [Anaerolineae bacterium]|nr:hypothetical protein [Anaerolineae bacterium]